MTSMCEGQRSAATKRHVHHCASLKDSKPSSYRRRQGGLYLAVAWPRCQNQWGEAVPLSATTATNTGFNALYWRNGIIQVATDPTFASKLKSKLKSTRPKSQFNDFVVFDWIFIVQTGWSILPSETKQNATHRHCSCCCCGWSVRSDCCHTLFVLEMFL